MAFAWLTTTTLARCETYSHLSLMAEAFPSVLVRARVCAASIVTVDILLIGLLNFNDLYFPNFIKS
jgi:hypothetical protein